MGVLSAWWMKWLRGRFNDFTGLCCSREMKDSRRWGVTCGGGGEDAERGQEGGFEFSLLVVLPSWHKVFIRPGSIGSGKARRTLFNSVGSFSPNGAANSQPRATPWESGMIKPFEP